jgi:hypothetical protein
MAEFIVFAVIAAVLTALGVPFWAIAIGAVICLFQDGVFRN